MKQLPPHTRIDSVPTTFQVGCHSVVVARRQHRCWAVSVDRQPVATTFDTQAEAWEAGVREAAQLDLAGEGRPPLPPATPGQ